MPGFSIGNKLTLNTGLSSGSGLSVLGNAIGGFSPASLFAASEPGFWYDPSDLTTMFQDRAGTTPVTAVGQTVGLVLDKSQGMVLGPELVTNGTFTTDTAGWTQIATGTFSWDASGGIACTDVAGGDCNAQANITTVSGRWYRAQWTVRSAAGGWLFRIRNSNDYQYGYNTQTGSFTAYFRAGVTGTNTVNLLSADTDKTVVFDNISVKEIAGNHLVANSDAARGTYQVTSGYSYILFDGTDDGYVTGTITPGTDKAQVFAGVRKLSDTAACVAEMSVSLGTNAGTFYLFSGFISPTTGYVSWARGNAALDSNQAARSSATGADTAVIAATHDISGDLSTIRRNGVAGTDGTADKGTGNFLAYPLYVGRRAGTSSPFNGRLYSLIGRFGPTPDAATISAVETWVNTKTGAY